MDGVKGSRHREEDGYWLAFQAVWWVLARFSSFQFSSVTQSCLTLCDPMNSSTPGLPVQHQLPGSTQTHVHWVSNAIQPSHPLSSPSPSALNLSQHQVFSNESALHIRWPKYWSFSFNISPTNEHPGLISLQSKGLPRVFSKIRLPLESDLDFGWAFGSLSSLTFPQLTPCWPNQVGLAWVQRNTE